MIFFLQKHIFFIIFHLLFWDITQLYQKAFLYLTPYELSVVEFEKIIQDDLIVSKEEFDHMNPFQCIANANGCSIEKSIVCVAIAKQNSFML